MGSTMRRDVVGSEQPNVLTEQACILVRSYCDAAWLARLEDDCVDVNEIEAVIAEKRSLNCFNCNSTSASAALLPPPFSPALLPPPFSPALAAAPASPGILSPCWRRALVADGGPVVTEALLLRNGALITSSNLNVSPEKAKSRSSSWSADATVQCLGVRTQMQR